MTRSKPTLHRLCELTPGQFGDFFAYLAERSKGQTRDGKPYYLCKFRDARRTTGFMVWADGGRFEECETKWQEGGFYKIRGLYQESERYGPQIEIHQIREVNDQDRSDGFEPADLIDRSKFDSDAIAQPAAHPGDQ